MFHLQNVSHLVEASVWYQTTVQGGAVRYLCIVYHQLSISQDQHSIKVNSHENLLSISDPHWQGRALVAGRFHPILIDCFCELLAWFNLARHKIDQKLIILFSALCSYVRVWAVELIVA